MQLINQKLIYKLIIVGLSFAISVSATAEEDIAVSTINRLTTLSNEGEADAQYILGAMYQAGRGVPQNHFKAFEQFQKAASQGDAASQSKVGLLYLTGIGVRQDYSKAFEYSMKAANQKFTASYLPVASMYEKGQGVRQDKKRAKEWYGKYCDSGKQLGCDAYKLLNEQGY